MYKYLIFDLDGTLDNQMPSYNQAFSYVCENAGLWNKNIATNLFNDTAGTPLRQQFFEIISTYKLNADLETCISSFWKLVENNPPQPFPEVQKVIPLLFHQHYQLYITTGSKQENAKRRVYEMGLLPYFDLILGSSTELEKGAAHLHKFKEHTKDVHFEKNALYIGDGTADMIFAKEQRIKAIGITSTVSKEKLQKAGADHIILNVEELIQVLEEIKIS